MGRRYASGFEDGRRGEEPRTAAPVAAGKAGNGLSPGASKGTSPANNLILAQRGTHQTSAVQTERQSTCVALIHSVCGHLFQQPQDTETPPSAVPLGIVEC